jgi:hypothetical protein
LVPLAQGASGRRQTGSHQDENVTVMLEAKIYFAKLYHSKIRFNSEVQQCLHAAA